MFFSYGLLSVETKLLPELMIAQIIDTFLHHYPDSKVHGANMGPTWVLSVPDGPHVGPMNLAIRVWQLWSWKCTWLQRHSMLTEVLAFSQWSQYGMMAGMPAMQPQGIMGK